MSAPPRGSAPPTPEDWGRRSLTELRDMCRRQERLLRNEKFICRLPDRGKKIADTAARLQAAIAAREEGRRRSELFRSVSVDCKFRPSAAAEVAVDTGSGQGPNQTLDASPRVPGCSSVDIESSTATLDTHKDSDKPRETDCPENTQTPSSAAATACVPRRPVLAPAAGFSSSVDHLLADQLQGIEIVDKDEHRTGETDRARAEPPKKPHYMEVLELRASNPVPAPPRFKTHVLPTQPSGSLGPRGRRGSPVCSEERRRREKQHLEDVTAARLLPLHHLPAQLLPMEESLALQQQQQQQYEEMQAKLAAQKLAERLNIHMQSYNPEGEAAGRYREVRDEDDEQSSEEF